MDNVIFIISKDALSKEALPTYKNKYWKTPNIDELAKKGTVFTKYYAAAGSTWMAMSAMMAQRYTYQFENRKTYTLVPQGEYPSIFDRLHSEGFECHVIWNWDWHRDADMFSGEFASNGKTIFHDLHLLEKLYNQYEQIGTYRERINEGISLLKSSNVDGIIYVAMHDRHLDYLLDPMDTPLVYAYSHGTENDTYVTYSNKDSAADMIRYLLGKGHERIAVIAGHPHSYPTAQRLLGIQMAMQQAGLPLPAHYIRYGDWEYESGKKETQAILQIDPLPTAIFAMNDLMAAGCMAALQENGLRIPKDMAVAGFDNREIASYLQPPLTTIALPTPEIGVKAALHIMDMVHNPRPHPWREIIPCSIFERASV